MPIRRLVLDEFVPYRLSCTSNQVSERIAQVYRSLFNLTIPEWRLIAVIAESPGTTQQLVAQRTRMDKVTVSRACTALVSRQLVRREADSNDRRALKLTLTPSGDTLYAAVAPKALEIEAQIIACLSGQEISQLKALLTKLDSALA